MIVHLRSLLFSFLFFAFVESIVYFSLFDKYGGWLLFFVACFGIFVSRIVGKRFLFAILTVSLGLSSIGLLYFIDNLQEKQIFGALVSLLFYMLLLGIKRISDNPFDMTARSLFSSALIAIVFLFYSVVYGIYINFDVPLWLFMLIHFVFVASVTFVSLRAYSSNYKRIFLYSLVIAFAMAQLVWMANFWPFGYLTTATISLMFYYVLWDLVQMFFLDTLSKKHIITTIVYCVALVIMLLLTTQWLLLN